MPRLPSQPTSSQIRSAPDRAGWQARRGLFLWSLTFVAGALMLTGVVPVTREAGVLALVVAACGCAWEGNRWARDWRKSRRERVRDQAQVARKAARRVRQTHQRQQQRQQTATRQHATRRQETEQRRDRQVKSERAAHMEAQRLARFEQVAREAMRLYSLEDAGFNAELPAILVARGLSLQNHMDEPTALRLKRLENGNVEVARILPREQIASVADVEALEQWRQQADAAHAYLIGRSGFTPAALRLAQRYPLTFVEPQLLAQWKSRQGEEPCR